MKHNILRSTLIVFALIFFQDNCCWGMGGSIIGSGAFGRYYGGETGNRQFVRLQPNGSILSAIPRKSPIHLITVHVPGLNGGHLIIRELELADQQKSIFISVPKDIRSYIKRATIYLSSDSKDVLIYQKLEGGWEPIEAIKMIKSDYLSDQAGLNDIWAFSVDHFGHFLISNKPLKMNNNNVLMSEGIKAGIFPIGSVYRGFFPWICAGMLFIIVGTLSYFIHKMECVGRS